MWGIALRPGGVRRQEALAHFETAILKDDDLKCNFEIRKEVPSNQRSDESEEIQRFQFFHFQLAALAQKVIYIRQHTEQKNEGARWKPVDGYFDVGEKPKCPLENF